MALVPVLSTNKALAKLTIIPFTVGKNGRLRPALLPPFVAMYNPSTFSTSHGTILQPKAQSDGIKSVIELKSQTNDAITVELLLDATGASPAGGFVGSALSKSAKVLKGVDLLVAAFFVTTQVPDPITHKANALKLVWGAGLFFECYLETATVTYTLFGRDGRPIRAKINATFKQTLDQSSLAKIKNFFSSPDVTKTHIVKAGDTIYNIANQYYEDDSFYLQIAEANDLKNYRKLTPGMTLILPPVQKVEEA